MRKASMQTTCKKQYGLSRISENAVKRNGTAKEKRLAFALLTQTFQKIGRDQVGLLVSGRAAGGAVDEGRAG
jgi:hypothetical protein